MKESNKSSNNPSIIVSRFLKNGQSKTILLLHGFLGSGKIWDPMIGQLSKNFNIITLDLPGHGESISNEETLAMDYIADLVFKVLDKYNIDDVHVVGHSMGGYVGLEMLNKSESRISSLTLLNSTAIDDTEQKKMDRLRAVRVFDLSPKVYIKEAINNLFYEPNLSKIVPEVERLQQIALNTSPEGAKACLRGMRIRENHTSLVNNTSAPVQYIAGVHDSTVPYNTIIDQIHSDKINLVSLKDSGHMSFAEEHDACVNAIINFVNEV